MNTENENKATCEHPDYREDFAFGRIGREVLCTKCSKELSKAEIAVIDKAKREKAQG